MSNPIRWLNGFAMAALLGLSLIAPVAAQDNEADTLDLEDVDGLQRLVARYYSVDFEALMASMSTPGADESGDLAGYQFALAGVFEFENDDKAESGFDVLYEELRAGLFEGEDSEGLAIEESEIDDFGDEARAIDAIGGENDESFASRGLFVRDSQYIYYVIGTAGTEAEMQIVNDIAQAMLDAEPGDGDETFAEEGTSTGGIWDLFPAAGHEALGSMVPSADEVIFPEDASADEADS